MFEVRCRSRLLPGSRSNIRAFHDVVLRNGAMPMAILEQVVDEYIASAQRAHSIQDL